MNRGSPILTAVALLLLVTLARAEYRTVLIQVRHEANKASVTIYSDDPPDRKTAASVDEAVKVIGNMKGWGSSVGVYVTSERGLRGADLKKLTGAIADNSWLDLEYVGRTVPPKVGDHFLKE